MVNDTAKTESLAVKVARLEERLKAAETRIKDLGEALDEARWTAIKATTGAGMGATAVIAQAVALFAN